ncbi:hypothetical protein F2Q69_00063583 [Brassica cretica]|uniref:Uncharacterized protein n=1 Tax=Brassica cretica TaxID=69181 RepID=A0A8S9RK13_BRACR|nr:hypothetical protein F2Q69_00063583 [Brassica cretica]
MMVGGTPKENFLSQAQRPEIPFCQFKKFPLLEVSFGPSKLLTVHHRVPPATPVDGSDYLRHQTPHRRRNSPQTDNEAGRTISTKRSNPLSKGTTKNFLKDPSLSPSQIPLGIPELPGQGCVVLTSGDSPKRYLRFASRLSFL